MKTRQEDLFDKLVDKLKLVFDEKYSLLLRKLDIDTCEINGTVYLLDVKEIMLEKFQHKNIKLKSERRMMNFQKKYQYKCLKINRDAPNIKEIKHLFYAMKTVYGQSQTGLDKYITLPHKDSTTDTLFQILRPDCPFSFSQLLQNQVTKKTFANYASTNLWNI